MRFQDLFHSPPGVLFAFPSRYLFTIGLLGVFSLTGWCRQIQSKFLQPRHTQVLASLTSLPVRDYHPILFFFPENSSSYVNGTSPTLQPQSSRSYKLVWANPRSLATTYGITIVFFSSGYLDVSVPQVSLSSRRTATRYLQAGGLFHSEICGSIHVG